MDQTSADLYQKFFEIAEKGDETAAKEFLVMNFKQFPQEIQDTIITAFLEEALAKKNSEDGAIAGFQTQGVATMNSLAKIKEELEKKLKLIDIKKSL